MTSPISRADEPDVTGPPATMVQARLHGVEDLRLDEVEIPPLPEDGVLVRVEAAGLCGSDLHMYRGVDPWGALATLPATFGHESAGTVVWRGRAVDGVGEGDLVAIRPMYLHACRDCPACRSGMTNACHELGLWHGRHRGAAGFGQYEVVSERNVTRFAPGVDAEIAALTDIFACAVHALHRIPADVRTVAVVGTGPIALALAQTCRWSGLEVAVLGRRPERLDYVRQLDLADVAFVRAGDGVFGRGADVAIECVGGSGSDAMRVAVEATRPRGWLGVLGAFEGDVALPYRAALARELTVTFLNGYCATHGDDFARSAELLSSGAVRARELISHRVPLEDLAPTVDAVARRRHDTMKVMVGS